MHAPPFSRYRDSSPPRGNQECANEGYRKAISLACHLGKVPSEVRRKGEACGVVINISRCNPSVCSQSSQPPSLSGKIYQTCGRLIFANLFNFYMLPARELASPQAMTEGCATSQYCRAHLNGRGKRVASQLIYRVASLPSARKARSHLPFQGRYIRPAEG